MTQNKTTKKIQNEHVYSKQTANKLGRKYEKFRQWIFNQLNKINSDDK